jgi:glycosyltransferase involved in cell wall biosynthesis
MLDRISGLPGSNAIRKLTRATIRRFGPPGPRVAMVADNVNWALTSVARYLAAGTNAHWPGFARVTTSLDGRGPTLAHCVSQYAVADLVSRLHDDQLAATSFMHGRLDEHPDDKRIVKALLQNPNLFPMVITTTEAMRKDLIARGVEAARTVRIPLGVDLRLFAPASAPEKAAIRSELGIPEDRFAIGSFQKDGDGWGDGENPKWIKGPDVFCDTMEILARRLPIFVVLTGPARGYVKKRLAAANIPYSHTYLSDLTGMAKFYHALDLYLVASRVEGGPLAIVESWATRTPLVTTAVGMAPDICIDGVNALVRPIEDTGALAEACEMALVDRAATAARLDRAQLDVLAHDWPKLADLHCRLVYAPLLKRLGVETSEIPASGEAGP